MAPKVARNCKKTVWHKIRQQNFWVYPAMSISSLQCHLLASLSRCSCTRQHLQRRTARATTLLQLTTVPQFTTRRAALLCSQWMHARKAFPDVMRWNSFPLEVPRRQGACAGSRTSTYPSPTPAFVACLPTLSLPLSLSLSLPPCSVHVTR